MRGLIYRSVFAWGLVAFIAMTLPAQSAIWGLGRVLVEPRGKNCFIVSFTRSADTKAESQMVARAGLKLHVNGLIQRQGWWRSRAKIRAKRARPNPSMRSSVPRSEFLKPDIVTARDYTQCWEGVIAPAICTAGALVCK